MDIEAHIRAYAKALDRHHRTGAATEHTHRPALKALLEAAIPGVLVTNEPKQIACGAPDFVLTRGRSNIPFGYVEAKDIGKSLDDKAHKEQLKRYTESLDNLIFTNYTAFRLYRDGAPVSAVSIAEASRGRIKPQPESFAAFADLLAAFAGYEGQTITSAADLARRMAAKARMLARVIEKALGQAEQGEPTATATAGEANETLQSQLAAFQEHLIHDIDAANFADIYAQTVAYGMFAARLHDRTPATFSRREAAELIPSTNPFLRKFFQHIAGYELDERIRWIVDDLADIFRAADVGELMRGFGKSTQQSDPFLHFYETFLGEYNPRLRRSRGVFYTPEPVVNFIVRAVDEILRTEFDLPAGLADTGKTTLKLKGQPSQQVHKVQILDPATGTGTFLAAIVKQIYEQHFVKQQGSWPGYVRSDLIPRLHGFEVLMASYAMAHTKLEMVLRETGCELSGQRLRVFLTNSLEEHHPDTGTLFAQWLAAEAREANAIKRDTPVMVVIGNPPYAVESSNKGEWITNLLKDYKQEPGGGKLKERNSKSLNDDYVKFIRYGQHYIDRTDKGVLAYINNNGFLDSPTFRGMRWSLLQSFDKIYILDLHGTAKKKETAPDGSADKNVFDIQQGVSINLFIKTGEKSKGSARVFHHDLYGLRESKYQFLWERDLEQVGFEELKPQAPQYFFVQKDYDLQSAYESGFSMKDLFPENGSGVGPKRDKLSVHFLREKALEAARDIGRMEKDAFYKKYSLPADVRDWRYEWAKEDISHFGVKDELIQPIQYRPFDVRQIVYTGRSRGFIGWPVLQIMRHFIAGDNVGLITIRTSRSPQVWRDIFVTNTMATSATSITSLDKNFVFPLYLYPDEQSLVAGQTRKPNLDEGIVRQIADGLGLRFTPEKQTDSKTFAPIDLLDYIYAVLHAPSYRERYKEFLKIDFPRVPCPTDRKAFRKLVKLGGELRALHLLESPTLDALITGYPEPGDNTVEKPAWKLTDTRKRLGKAHINKTQYFEDVPEVAWLFHIGGYQPAQKWLKDRKSRTLTHTDIIHYQKIIKALTETARLMGEVDKALGAS